MIIYHGSKEIVKAPQFGKGKTNNDYGKGFYCTEDKPLAFEWAVDSRDNGFANSYDLDDTGLQILNLDEISILSWIAILLENRNFNVESALAKEAKKYIIDIFLPDYLKADIIVGYRADDSYFSYASDFINGIISLEQLSKALRLGNLGKQIVLKSPKAFEQIKFIDAEEADSRQWFPLKEQRDKKARLDYSLFDKTSFYKGEMYVIKIIEEEVKPNDPRIRF